MIQELLPDIRRAARSVAFKWSGVTTEEDMTQELTTHILERPKSLEVLTQMSSDRRVRNLVTIGHKLAGGLRDDLEVFSGNFTYSVDDVKKLLDRGALEGHMGGFDAAVEDLTQAMVELASQDSNHWGLIKARYDTGGSFDKRRLSEAVERLTTLMNRLSSTARYTHENGGRFRNNRQATNQVDLDYVGEVRYDG